LYVVPFDKVFRLQGCTTLGHKSEFLSDGAERWRVPILPLLLSLRLATAIRVSGAISSGVILLAARATSGSVVILAGATISGSVGGLPVLLGVILLVVALLA